MLDFSSKPHPPINTLCLILSAPEILPYIVRSSLLKDGEVDGDIFENAEEILAALDLPLDEFEEEAGAGALPEDFFDSSAAEEFSDTERCFWMDGEINFLPIPRLIPPGAQNPSDKAWFAKYNHLDTLVYFFQKQPCIFSDEPSYKDGDELIAAAKAFLAEIGVEMPEDFPYWKVIGTVQPYDLGA